MKWSFLIIGLGLIALTSSCEKSNSYYSNGILGQWLLIEQLADPGDGSGTFQPVTSNKVIEFYNDGTFVANGNMCTMSSQADSVSYGTYDTVYNSFSPSNCMFMAPMAYSYSLNGDELILSYPCICGCQQKYIRI